MKLSSFKPENGKNLSVVLKKGKLPHYHRYAQTFRKKIVHKNTFDDECGHGFYLKWFYNMAADS